MLLKILGAASLRPKTSERNSAPVPKSVEVNKFSALAGLAINPNAPNASALAARLFKFLFSIAFV